MGERIWLETELNEWLLPAIARLKNTPKGRAQMEGLYGELRERWEKRGLRSLAQQQGPMDQTRRAIKDQLGEDHFSLELIRFSTEEYTQINSQKQGAVAHRNEHTKQLEDPEAIVAIAVRLLESREWAEVAAGLAVLTGRRCAEILSTARFELKSQWSVTFTGALKRRGEVQLLTVEIPTLTTAKRVCLALEKLRGLLPEAVGLEPRLINQKYEGAVARACDRWFVGVVPLREGKDSLYTHLFRAVYATIAVFWYCPPSVNEVEFKAAIQGHFAVLDESNPEQRRSLAASRHYADYEMADRVIAQVGGKRKGIKLGLAGVTVIDLFRGAMVEVPAVERRERSSVRIWQADKGLLEEVLVLLGLEEGTQQDRLGALLRWAKEQLVVAPGTEPEATDEPVLVEEPRLITPEIALPAPLEMKMEELLGVMSQLVQLQLQERLGEAQKERGPRVDETAEVIAADLKERKKYKTGVDELRLNRAVDAIMAHNNQPGLSHDLKWAITINSLKAFSPNQRAIEKLIGKGKDNPQVQRIVGTREEEILAHHQAHQLDPKHNHRHKQKRKIIDVVKVDG